MPEKILMIEDDEFFSAIVSKHLLHHNNFHCDIASSVEQAAALLKDGRQYFAAIVDLELPGSEIGAGLTLTSQCQIPSIIFTGNDNPDIYQQFISSTLLDFVNKTGAGSIRYVSSLLERVYRNQFMKVLVVDDSPSARQSLCALLQNSAFQVASAGNGKECLAALTAKPDIVILDQYLPDIMGYDLCAEVKRLNENPHCQIIGVSSKKDRKLSALFLKNSGNDFIHRPFDPEEFCKRINQRAELIDHIRELERLSEEKNQFLAMAVHDLRNPLNAIQQASKRISKFCADNERVQAPLEMIYSSTKGMQHLVDDLLDISTIETGKFELEKIPLNLADISQQSLTNFQERARDKNITISSRVPDSIMVEVDPGRISQVIDNLLSNAIKYSPHDREITLALEKNHHHVRLSIEDQGPGIDHDDLEHLFVPFKRLGHATTGGESSHGLGLSICYKIIAAHNGKIRYQDATLGGSCFYFELPLN